MTEKCNNWLFPENQPLLTWLSRNSPIASMILIKRFDFLIFWYDNNDTIYNGSLQFLQVTYKLQDTTDRPQIMWHSIKVCTENSMSLYGEQFAPRISLYRVTIFCKKSHFSTRRITNTRVGGQNSSKRYRGNFTWVTWDRIPPSSLGHGTRYIWKWWIPRMSTEKVWDIFSPVTDDYILNI